MEDNGIKMFYIRKDFTVVEVVAFPRRHDYWWVPTEGYSVCEGHGIEKDRDDALRYALDKATTEYKLVTEQYFAALEAHEATF